MVGRAAFLSLLWGQFRQLLANGFLALLPLLIQHAISNVFLNDAHGGSGPSPAPAGEILLTDALPTSDSTDSVSDNGIWSTLAPGDTVRMTGSYVVTQSDIDNLQ